MLAASVPAYFWGCVRARFISFITPAVISSADTAPAAQIVRREVRRKRFSENTAAYKAAAMPACEWNRFSGRSGLIRKALPLLARSLGDLHDSPDRNDLVQMK